MFCGLSLVEKSGLFLDEWEVSEMDYSNSTAAQEYVKENRKDLIKLIRHEDTFIRALGFAILLEGGDKMETEMVKRELELLQKLGDDYDDLY